MSDFDHVVLKEPYEERTNDRDGRGGCRPLDRVGHLSVVFAVQVHVERLGAIRHDEDLLVGVEDRHWDLSKVYLANSSLFVRGPGSGSSFLGARSAWLVL